MARGRSASYDDQREMILAQAAACFAQRGYAATSMNQVAEACGLSKATLYHYFRDKYALLVQITEGHVRRLHALVREAEAEVFALHGGQPRPEQVLRRIVLRFVEEYADAQAAHRVLTEDVRFLEPADRERVLELERAVVTSLAHAVVALRPELAGTLLPKPLTMLLFGMINWMFTWLRPSGPLGHDAMAPVVADLFIGGLAKVKVLPSARAEGHAASTGAARRPLPEPS